MSNHAPRESEHDHGTTVRAGSSSATFKSKEADLDLPSPLKVGENPIDLTLEKPKGRAETVKLVVPVAFRVQPDLAQITAVPPALVVRIEARPGATVTIDGASITLDGAGAASQTIPLGDEARGPADEMKTFVKTLAYEVTHDRPFVLRLPQMQPHDLTGKAVV